MISPLSNNKIYDKVKLIVKFQLTDRKVDMVYIHKRYEYDYVVLY